MRHAFFDWVLRHPLWVIVGCLLLTVACGAGLGRLSFTTDYRAYFGPDNPELKALLEIERNFTRAETLLIGVAPREGDVFTPETIRAIRELSDAWWELPFARGAASITTFYQAWGEGDDVLAEPLVPEDVDAEDLDLDSIRRQALSNDRLRYGLLAPDGRVTGVVAYFELPHANPQQEISDVANAAYALKDRIEKKYPHLELHMSGVMMFNQALAETIERDGRELFPLSYLVMFVLLAILLRGLTPMVVTVGVIIMSVVVAMGLTGWAGIQLTTASITAGVIIMTLSVADCVHVLVTYEHERSVDRDKIDSLREALRVNLQPVFLTSITTALGFLSMNFSDSPPYQDLGNIVAVGVAAAFFFSLVFLPAALMVLPSGRTVRRMPLEGAMTALAEFVIRRRSGLLVASVIVIGTLAACTTRNEFGDNYVKFFDESMQFRQATEFINDNMTGMQYVEYGVPAQGKDGIYDAAYLANMEKLVDWFRAQPEVVKVSSVIDLLKRLNRTMRGGDISELRLPESRELAAQYLFFYEISLPAGVGITHLVNMEKSSSRITVQLDTITSEEIRRFDIRAREWMAQNLPPEMHSRGTGISIMFANIARRNFASMITGTLVAFGFIALVLIFSFGSPRLGFVSLAPNLIPAICGFGIWGLVSGQLGSATSVVASLTLGIVVDDTVHFMSKYARARRERGLSSEDAVRYAFRNVGVALLVTSAVLIGGFLVLLDSSFMMNVQLGALTAIIIGVALIADFLFLPPLLMTADRRRTQAPSADQPG